MDKKELVELKRDWNKRLNDWVKKGGKITTYHCPHCKSFIPTRRPSKEDCGSKGYWDSATVCVECGKTAFVAVHISGDTRSL